MSNQITTKNPSGSVNVSHAKLLSMVVMGRNDDYMGNFKYRLTTCINYAARNLKKLGRLDDVEFMVTDWNSDVPLSKVLPLSSEAAQITRFIYVPPETAKTVQRPDQVFFPYCAVNVSVRRAQGKFIMGFDADSLIPCHSLRALFDVLDDKSEVPFDLESTFFVFSRFQLPWEIVQREPSLEEWDRYLIITGSQLPRDAGLPGLGIACAALMMHRSLWDACRGCNEQFLVQGWGDAELTLRLSQRYPWVDLLGVGVSLFHMEHWTRNKRVAGEQEHNPSTVSPVFAVNDANWGLGNYELEIQTAAGSTKLTEEPEPNGSSMPIRPQKPMQPIKALPPLSPPTEAQESDQNIRSDEYIRWLCWVLGGWLRPESGNLRAFDCAVRHMPAGGALIEIGSFLGLSTNIIAYLTIKYNRDNPFFTCDPWAFEGTEQKVGGYFDGSTKAYRDYAKQVFIMNANLYSADKKPYTIEAYSTRFFELWSHKAVAEDVLGRSVPVSFAYIDGNHTYEATKEDFQGVDRHLLSGGFVLFDDSADNSGHEGATRAALEVMQRPDYELVFKTPNYFFRKKNTGCLNGIFNKISAS